MLIEHTTFGTTLMKNTRKVYHRLGMEYRQYNLGIVAIALTLTTVNHQIKKGDKVDDIKVLKELLEIIWGSEKPKRKVKKKKPRDSKGRYIKRR